MDIKKSDEWIAVRRKRIGGSNAAASVGLSPYKSQLQLYYEMTEGRSVDLHNNPDILRGILLEPICRSLLASKLNLEVSEHDQNNFLSNEKYPWAGCTPDGWIAYNGSKIPIEIKVPRPENWEKLDTEVPSYIKYQCIHNTAVSESSALMLVCLNSTTMELYSRLYEPLQEDIDALMSAEERFYNQHIVPRIPPPAQTHNDLKLLFPEHKHGKSVVAPAYINEVWDMLQANKTKKKVLEDNISDLSFKIQAFMGDAEVLRAESGGTTLATWKSHQVSTLDISRLKTERPEIYAEYVRECSQRPFLLKPARVTGSLGTIGN